MPGLCEGRVVAITGAGRGIGREHAILFGKEGAKIVVNDVDADVANQCVADLKKMGFDATAHSQDCSTWEGGHSLIQTCIDTYGTIDTLVNNAGILRDRTAINMKEDEWDAIQKVHGKGTFIPTNAALNYWRKCATEGKPRKGRIICTSSTSGIYGNIGQANYAYAKAGLAAFALVVNAEAERLGCRVNTLVPNARTRMTLSIPGDQNPFKMEVPKEKFDDLDPANMCPVVVWFGSDACEVGGVTCMVNGRQLTVMEGWSPGKSQTKEGGPEVKWAPSELTNVIPKLYQESAVPQIYQRMGKKAGAKAMGFESKL